MKKFTIQVIILITVILGSFYFAYNRGTIGFLVPTTVPSSQRLSVGQTVINVEIADTPALRTKGLSGKSSLDSGSGMLFVFDQSQKARFWMKGMKFSLDMIFIDNGQVVDILKNITPPEPGQSDPSLPVYEPVIPIKMMLEVNSGFVDANKIKIGDKVALLQNQP